MFVFSARRPRCCQQSLNLFYCDSEIFVNSAWSVILAHCHFDVALLTPRPVAYALFAICFLSAPVLFGLFLFRFRFIKVKEDFFPAELKWADFLRSFFWLALHDPVVHCARLFQVLANFSVVLLFPPRRVDLLVPPTERKEGQTSLPLLQFSWHYWSAAVLIILPTLVICIQLPPTLLFVLSLSE